MRVVKEEKIKSGYNIIGLTAEEIDQIEIALGLRAKGIRDLLKNTKIKHSKQYQKSLEATNNIIDKIKKARKIYL